MTFYYYNASFFTVTHKIVRIYFALMITTTLSNESFPSYLASPTYLCEFNNYETIISKDFRNFKCIGYAQKLMRLRKMVCLINLK